MGLLNGQIAQQIFAGFKGRLLSGTLTRISGTGGVNDLGDPVGVSPQSWTCEGFTDNYSAMYRKGAGIPETDVKVSIFAASLGTAPQKDDQVTFNSVTYQLRSVRTDPATALWECQGSYVAPPPTSG